MQQPYVSTNCSLDETATGTWKDFVDKTVKNQTCQFMLCFTECRKYIE